ncbi:MAG: methyltransferase domain-containing protein [Nitrospira sp.]|nr:MAG: methyltransferase domain-containing protein [Nitrospira sp.]
MSDTVTHQGTSGRPAESLRFDSIHPSHPNPDSTHRMRAQVADLIVKAGHRRVLDLPAGSGELSYLLLQKGLDVTAADLEPETFIVPGRTCVKADMNSRLPFPDAQFDAIGCIEGIEHIENPHLFVREANRLLRPGGMLYITTPNVLSIRSRLGYLLRGYPNQFHYMIELDPKTDEEIPIAHINPIGFLELRYVLARWGFRITAVETNQYIRRNGMLYRLLRLLMQSRGKRAAASHPKVADIRNVMLSDAVLFGDSLIVTATKIRKE